MSMVNLMVANLIYWHVKQFNWYFFYLKINIDKDRFKYAIIFILMQMLNILKGQMKTFQNSDYTRVKTLKYVFIISQRYSINFTWQHHAQFQSSEGNKVFITNSNQTFEALKKDTLHDDVISRKQSLMNISK